MATNIVKSLQFPGSDDLYQINAAYLDGWSRADIEERLQNIEGFDALVYEGALTPGLTAPGAFTPPAEKGAVYKVNGNGYINGATVELGDMLICNTKTDAANETNYVSIAANWDIIQVNIDVNAILDHYHKGTVELTKTNRNLIHNPDCTTVDVAATLKNATATINTPHTHEASGTVQITPEGTVQKASITPEGTVKIGKGDDFPVVTSVSTTEDVGTAFLTEVKVEAHNPHKHNGTTNSSNGGVTGTVSITTGNGDANYTPAGEVNESTAQFVTEVTGQDTTVSKHTAYSELAGAFTPAGTVTVDTYTPEGAITGSIGVTNTFTDKSESTNVMSSAPVYAVDENKPLDGILRFGSQAVVTKVAASVASTANIDELVFSGSPTTITAQFEGNPVDGHTHDIEVDDHAAFKPQVSTNTATHTHTFTGTGVELKGTFQESATGHTHTFDTSEETLSHSVTTQSSDHNHNIDPTIQKIGATFTGTPADHTHEFVGTPIESTVDITVDDNVGDLTGSVTGTIELTNATGLVTGVTISEHTIQLVDSASVTTGSGLVRVEE